MPQNPAIDTYEAWDNIYQFMTPRYKTYFDRLRFVDDAFELEQPDRTQNTGVWTIPNPLRLGNTTHGIVPAAVHRPTGRLVYKLIRTTGGDVDQHLFTLSPDGTFRLGREFGYDLTWRWGPYDNVAYFTKFFDFRYDIRGGKVCYIHNEGDRWTGVRDWRHPVPYWQPNGVSNSAWFFLARQQGRWVARIDPEQPNASLLHVALNGQYERAEERYERFERRHYREKGIPYPRRSLSKTEIETVEHISQHINLHEPGKARLLREVTPSC